MVKKIIIFCNFFYIFFCNFCLIFATLFAILFCKKYFFAILFCKKYFFLKSIFRFEFGLRHDRNIQLDRLRGFACIFIGITVLY